MTEYIFVEKGGAQATYIINQSNGEANFDELKRHLQDPEYDPCRRWEIATIYKLSQLTLEQVYRQDDDEEPSCQGSLDAEIFFWRSLCMQQFICVSRKIYEKWASTVKKSKEDLLRLYLIAGADTAVSLRSYLSFITPLNDIYLQARAINSQNTYA